MTIVKDKQYYKFCFYGFLKNLRFFEAFFILYLKQNGLSYTEIGSLYALREIVTNLSEVPTGIFADTFGRKKALVLSFVAYIFSFVLFYTANSYHWFLTAFLLYGLADAFRSGTHKAMIMDYLKLKTWSRQKIAYYGYTRSCSQRGSALSALIAGLIIFLTNNYRLIFLLSVLPYVLNLFLIWSYPNQLDRSVRQKHTSIKTGLRNLIKALKSPTVWRIVHSAAVFTAYQKAVKDYIQPVMKQLAMALPVLLTLNKTDKIGLLIGVMYFVLYILTSKASRLSGILVKKINDAPYTTLIFGFVAGTLGGLFYDRRLWGLSLLFFALIYIIESLRKPVLTGYLSDNVPNEILASVLSAQSLYRTLLTSILAIMFGFLTDQLGLGMALVWTGIILLVLTFLIKKHPFSNSHK